MGIQNLLPFLGNSTRDAHISEFENEFVAIDAYCWLHKGIYSCAFELAMKKPTAKYVTYCMRYIEMLLHFKVKPILVFDGRQLSSKSETEKKRREDRRKKYERGRELMRAGNHLEGRKLLGESVDVTHELALQLIKQCRQKNIDCIVAPYEADAQLSFLSLRNIVKCIITEDSDLLVYGSERVMFKMDTSGRGKLIEKSEIHFSLSMTPEEFNEDIFRYMCILSGCDYLPSLPSIGLANALKFIKMLKGSNIYSVLPKLPIYLKKMNVKVTPEYIAGFQIADNTFKHQLVYDPFSRSQVPLRPVENDDEIVGTKLEDDLAFNLAVGNIDPMTMKKLDCYDPDKTAKGFSLLWRTDLLPDAAPRHPFSSFYSPPPETKKRQRENLDFSTVQPCTNDLKKQCIPFNIKSSTNLSKKNGARKIPDSGFIFDAKIAVEKKTVPDESKLLKSRYFSIAKDTGRGKKEAESANDRRKDESYEDYLQRLYNEYFPIGENEGEQTRKGYDCVPDTENVSPEIFCSLCRKDNTCCSCSNESADVSDSRELSEYRGDIGELKNSKEKSVEQHFLLDEIYKSQMEKLDSLSKKPAEKGENEETPERVSPSHGLSLDFSKMLSKLAETPETKAEIIEKENNEVVFVEEQDFERSPSPVFKIQRDTKILNRTCRVGNAIDTTRTQTSVYFSPSERLNGSIPVSSRCTTPKRKPPSIKRFSSVPTKARKNNLKTSSVNKTLFQFGFKKERHEEKNSVV